MLGIQKIRKLGCTSFPLQAFLEQGLMLIHYSTTTPRAPCMKAAVHAVLEDRRRAQHTKTSPP